MHADQAAVATMIRQILTERGPLEEEQLYDALVAAQAPMGDEPEEFFDDLTSSDELGSVLPLTDGRYCWLPSVLQDRIFTHRLTEREIEHDLLEVTPDLDLPSLLTEGPHAFGLGGVPMPVLFDVADLPAGRDIPQEAISAGGDFLLPAGTLSGLGVKPEELIGLRVGPDQLSIERVDDVCLPPRSLPAALMSQLDEDEFHFIDVALATLCADDAELFRRPLSPASEILDMLGLARHGDRFAAPGFDFDVAFFEQRVRFISDQHALEADEAMAVALLMSLFDDVAELAERMAEDEAAAPAGLAEPQTAGLDDPYPATSAPEVESLQLVLQYLPDPDVVSAVLEETLYLARGNPASLIALAGGLELQAPREARAPLRWLQAKAYEHLGDVEAAEKVLDEAEGLDPSWPLTLLDLARYASDRGDATRALGLLRRAGIEEDGTTIEMLRGYQPAPRPDMRRNAPCWCGSGRKYKVCHLNREQLPLAQRAGWLYEKAQEHLRTDRWPTLLIGYAEFRVSEDSDEDLADAVFDPFVRDVLLAEGGAFEDFFVRRGRLLPEDERELAAQWLGVKRSVYEIVRVQPGHGLTLRDVATDERHDVEHQETSDLRTGELVCARVFPVEGTLRCFADLEPVPLNNLDAVLEALDEQDCRAVIEAVAG
jgi:tetratricopeptide (TPR) repeat protein